MMGFTVHSANFVLSFALGLVAGLALGLCYFRSLWWVVQRLAGGTGVTGAIAVEVARFTGLAAILLLAARMGAAPLLGLGLGLVCSRPLVTRNVASGAVADDAVAAGPRAESP